jgi:hypothetical protein
MRKQYHSVRVIQTFKSKFIETEAKSIPLAHVYMNAHFMHFWDWDRHAKKVVELEVVSAQTSSLTEMMRSFSCFPHVRKMATLT